MTLDAIKKINETEQAIAVRKEEAAHNARRMVAEAEKAGQAAVEAERQRAHSEGRQLLRQTEAEARQQAEQDLAQTRQLCASLKEKAASRLDAAAEQIAGRIVNR